MNIYKIICIFAALVVLCAGSVAAENQDLVKQADKLVRNAERQMFNGKNSEADGLLQEAAALIEQAKAANPDDNKVVQLGKKYDRIRKQVDTKLGKTDKMKSSTATTLPPKPTPKAMPEKATVGSTASSAPSSDKLPSGVSKRLRDIERHLDAAERYVGKGSNQAEYKLDQAKGLFDEIDKNYSGQFDPGHPEFASVQNRYDDLVEKAKAAGEAEIQAKAEAESAEAAKKEQSEKWVAQFREYLSYPGETGHNPDKLVFVPGTSEPEKFEKARNNFNAFITFYDSYKTAEFPHGKTWELEDIADREAVRRIEIFEEEFASREASVAGDADKGIDSAMNYLMKDTGWQSDEKIKPMFIGRDRLSTIEASVQKTVSALGESDAKSQAIRSRFDQLVAKNNELREIRKQRTFMIPDQYAGSDSQALKEKAESLVIEHKTEGGTPVRCTIISKDWQEQTVKEWTDTSKTQWRMRTTRSITAQVAARTGSGCRLITVALAKDLQSNGSWGSLYGNLHQYSEPMLEENINK